MDKPSQITELLHHTNSPVEGVVQRGQFLHRLDKLVASLLDNETKPHCQVGNIRDGVLILYADSTAWSTRLRYQAPALLTQLQQRKSLASLQRVEVRVVPAQQGESPRSRRATMSSTAASCLNACAEGVNDEALSRALERLAAHQKRQD